MAIWVAIILGLVQGITEFLPISSSGHLLMFREFFGIEADLLFDIILHIATLLAVIIVFRKKIWELIKNPLCKTNICLLIATLISCVMVVLFNDLFEKAMRFEVLIVTFLITAFALLAINYVAKKIETRSHKDPNYRDAFIAGFAQGLAVIPGISRSGSTLVACLGSGMERKQAAEFSFLMSIPIIIASFMYELIFNNGSMGNFEFWPVFFGCVAAFVSAIIAIKFMLKIIKNIQLYWFSIYLFVLSAGLIIYLIVT